MAIGAGAFLAAALCTSMATAQPVSVSPRGEVLHKPLPTDSLASARVQPPAIAGEHVVPEAVTSAGFKWRLLAPEFPSQETDLGEARVDSQFWTANVNPTDKYVLSLPGTQSARISPLDPKFNNLTVAGDWTACGHMAGCVEAAVMSGQLAAHAICQSPRLEEIVGYDHP